MKNAFLGLCGFFAIVFVLAFFLFAVFPPTYPLPIAATANPIGTKLGSASGHTYFMFFGDASNANIQKACQNGGITKISTVDYRVENFLFIKQTYTVSVNGE